MFEASHIPRNVLQQLFNIAFRCNIIISFDSQVYQQIQGMVMEQTRIAPSYANLFIEKFERSFLVQEPILPLVWKRYIDDILCLWTGARSELDKLDKAHKTPRFTWSISDKHIEFLELRWRDSILQPTLI